MAISGKTDFVHCLMGGGNCADFKSAQICSPSMEGKLSSKSAQKSGEVALLQQSRKMFLGNFFSAPGGSIHFKLEIRLAHKKFYPWKNLLRETRTRKKLFWAGASPPKDDWPVRKTWVATTSGWVKLWSCKRSHSIANELTKMGKFIDFRYRPPTGSYGR